MFKKIMIGISTLVFAFSCSTLTAQEYFEQGRYIDSLKVTAKELTQRKNPLTIEEENQIAYRIKQVESIYNNKLLNSYDYKSKASAYFELWEMIYIIESNPSLSKYVNYSIKYKNSYELLAESQRNILKYVEDDRLNRVDSLLPFLDKLGSYGAQKTQFNTIYENLAKYTADTYIDIARNYENSGRYESSANYYYKASQVYSNFASNYRGSYDKYVSIKKAIELSRADGYYNDAVRDFQLGRYENAKTKFEYAKEIYRSYNLYQQSEKIDSYLNTIKQSIEISNADKYFNEGVRYYESRNYSSARSKFEEARKLYLKYGNTFKVNQVDSYLSTLGRSSDLDMAKKYFDEGLKYYQNRNYTYARNRFEQAKKIYVKYGMSYEISQIDSYLSTIGRTNDLDVAKKYFDEGLRYYQNRNYTYARDRFEQSKKIYTQYGMIYEISNIDYYLDNIKRMNNNTDTNRAFEGFYNQGLTYQNTGDRQYDYSSRAFYYKMAIREYRNALLNTTNRNSIYELNERISKLENYINNYK